MVRIAKKQAISSLKETSEAIRKVAVLRPKTSDIDEPNTFTGVLIVYDHGEYTELFDIPAAEFDGKVGHALLKRLEKAHGTWINTENSNDDSVWLYHQISRKEDIYDDKGKQSKTDGPWHGYKLNMDRFNLIHGQHRIYMAGFAP